MSSTRFAGCIHSGEHWSRPSLKTGMILRAVTVGAAALFLFYTVCGNL